MTEHGEIADERAEEIGVLRALIAEGEKPLSSVDVQEEEEVSVVSRPEPSFDQPVTDLLSELQSPDEAKRRAVLRSLLGREPDMTTAAAAASALQDPDPGIRSLALRVLEGAPNLAPVDALAQVAREGDPALRARALVLMGQTGNPTAVEALHEQVAEERDDEVVGAALSGLALLSSTSGPVRLDEAALDRLVGGVSSLSPARHFRFASALHELAEALPRDEIVSRLGSPDLRVRLGAALLALEGGSEELLRALVQLMHDDDPDVRRLAMVGTARLGSIAEPGRGEAVDGVGELVVEALRPLADAALEPREVQAAGAETAEEAAPAFHAVPADVPDWLRRALEEVAVDGLVSDARRVAAERPDLLGLVAEALAGQPMDALRASAEGLREAAPWDDVLRAWRGDPDPRHRAGALRLSAVLRPDEAEDLAGRGLDDSGAQVRLAAIEASTGAFDRLWEGVAALARDDAFPAVRTAAMAAFRSASLERRLAVAESVLGHPDPGVRLGAVDLLHGGSPEEAVLLSRFLLDPDPAVAGRTTSLLGERPSTEVLPLLWGALRSSAPATRRVVIDVLTAFDRSTLARLAAQAVEAPVPSERAIGLRVRAALEGYGAFERLIASLEDPSPEVRLAALEALAELPSPAAVGPLGGRLRDPDAGVRLAATRALGRIDDDGVARELLRAAADGSDAVRHAGREGILARRSMSVARVLLQGLEDPALRRAAAELLGAMGEIASGLVVEALEDASDETREALGEALRAGEADASLVGRLQDPDPAVRRRALLGLRAMRAKGAVLEVLDRLHDPDPEVRVLAATTLGELGDPRAEEPLKRGFVSDPDMTVVAAIELALRRLMGGSSGESPA